jgi:hypothetical protein
MICAEKTSVCHAPVPLTAFCGPTIELHTQNFEILHPKDTLMQTPNFEGPFHSLQYERYLYAPY